MEYLVIVLVCLAALGWLLVSPFVLFSLWNRVNEMEQRIVRLQNQASLQTEPTREPSAIPVTTTAAYETPQVRAAAKSFAEVPLMELLAPPPAHGASAHSTKSDESQPVSVTQALLDKRRDAIRDQAPQPSGLAVDNLVCEESLAPPILTPAVSDPTRVAVAGDEERTGRSAQPTGVAAQSGSREESSTLEEILAGKWLTWIGALAVIIGAGFGFKYAVDNGWLDPSRRVMLGLLVGACSFVGGAFAMRRDYRFLGQGLTGAAMGVLYMSCFAAHEWYGLVPYSVAFLGMTLTTAIGLAYSARFDSQPTAFLGLLGGFLTPAMLQGQGDPFWVLFPYLLMLDAGVLWVAGRRRWLGVQNLAFAATCLSWFIWLGAYQHFDPVRFHQTGPYWPALAFLTAFFVEFAAMGVIFNILRQQPAKSGDFFLILATPVAYFGAAYGLTYQVFPFWQGLFAIGMTVIYGYLTVLCAQLNPSGKSVAAALAGLAGTFLIIAAPLQFTGHWVTIAWIAESVLLVELGLRFQQKTLTITGLSLLAKVQIILMIYALATFADPVGFQTAFVRKQFHLINGPAAFETSWTNIFNGRSFSYLVDVLGLGWLAWSCRRRAKAGQSDDLFGMKSRDLELWLAAGVPLIALMLAITETFVWGMLRQWHGLTILSGFTMWAALAGVALIAWSVFIGPRMLERLGWFLFVLMGGALLLNLGWTTVGILERGIDDANWAAQWWLFHPRGFGFLSVLVAGVLTALVYKVAGREGEEPLTLALSPQGRDEGTTPRVSLDVLFGGGAFILALTMVLLETFAWGKTHGWAVASIFNAFVVWASLFGAGLATWKFVRRSVGLDGLLVATFVLLGSFLALDSIVTLNRTQHETLANATSVAAGAATSTEAAVEWWLLNPRGLSFLLAIGAAVLTALLERRLRLTQANANEPLGKAMTRGEQFGLMACLVGLAVVLLETAAWGVPHKWLEDTLASSLALGTAPFALGLAVWAAWYRRRVLNGAVACVFVLLGVCLLVSGITALDGSSTVVAGFTGEAVVRLWLLHPRGAAFAIGIVAAGIASAFYLRASGDRAANRLTDDRDHTAFEFDADALLYSQTLGVSAWFAGLALFTIEAMAQGAARHWQTETSLAITLSWTAYALGTLVAGIYWRSGTVRVLALSVFLLTVAKVFLFDIWHLNTVIRFFAFGSLGVTLLLVSFLYRHYRERIRSWIAPQQE